MSTPTFAFFGTPAFAVIVLDELKQRGFLPALIVTMPDEPRGRGNTLTPPETKVWAEREDIPVLQARSLRDPAAAPLFNTEWDFFVVASYGAIIPKEVLDIPKKGTLNVHPSLLPQLRGASPIRTAILNDMRETGVSIMLMDEEVDHGPVLAQASIEIEEHEWPPRATMFESLLAHAGGELLAETIPSWIKGEITPEEQDHTRATYSAKITKDMGLLNLKDDPYSNLLKIRAYDGWPGTFFFDSQNGKRIKVTDAEIAEDGSLRLLRVIPEGKKEMSYDDYLCGSRG